MNTTMYTNQPFNKSKMKVDTKLLKIKGKSKHNIILESEDNAINIPSYEFVSGLETELKKSKTKIKTLEGIVNRMLVENTKIRNEVSILKQILGRI